MTAQVLFDTARFRDKLTSSGMPELQARAVTEGFEEALRGATATKADVEKLDAKIDGVEERLGARISLLDETVGRRIAEAQAAQSRWIIASMFGGLGLLFAALKLFP